MNNQPIIPHGLLYSIAPEFFSQLHISSDSFDNEFDWDESENQYIGESLASNVLDFLKEIGTKSY
jgi:hypothetical protein